MKSKNTVETTHFLISRGEMRVKEVFPGKKTANHRAEGRAVVNQVRTLETHVKNYVHEDGKTRARSGKLHGK